MWISAFGARSTHDAGRAGAGVVGLLLTSMHMTLLGALLALSPRALYVYQIATAGGRTPVEEQHLGGAIMLLVGGASYLAGGLWLSSKLLNAGAAIQRRGLG